MTTYCKARLRPVTLAVATLLAFGATCSVNAADAGYAGPVATIGSAANLHPNDIVLGATPAATPINVQIALKLRNQGNLDNYLAQPHATPLTPEQFAQRYSPTQQQAQKVANFLSEAGFHNVVIAPNRLLVSADGTTAIAAAAFGTSFIQVQTANGGSGYANNSSAQVPFNLQGIVLAVTGLQTAHMAHSFAMRLDPNAPHTLAVTGHSPVEFASIYGGSGQTTGAGVTVGIITQGKITQTITDLNTFTSQNGLATVTTQTVNTNGTSTDASGVDEWNLDSQDVVGMAGGQVGKLIFYNIPTLSNANLTADFNTVVTANAVKVLNVSLGECETDAQGDGSAASQDQIFQQAIAQGQTISVSTGDSGADECGNGGITPSWPAASQYVIAAAGTTLNASTTTWSSETVWSGSGGSQSTFEPKPSWQTLWSGSYRGVADIAFDGDPNSGAKIIVNGASTQVGGTSLSSPLFVGTWARVIAAKGTSIGFAGPLIYQLPTSAFHDITSGNNNGSTAAAGYDLASGRGSMIISSVLANIGGGGGGGGGTPAANFSYVTNGLSATFTDSSTDAGGTISAHAWTFGDGGTSSATSPSHTYAAAGTYSVTETVTDSVNATTNAKTESVTVTGGASSNVLSNGVPVTGLAATTGNQLSYTMVVPAGATNLKFTISGGTGDADLYVKFGSAPTLSSYDCRPWVTGNSESCPITTAQAGTYYVMINSYASFTGVSLTGSYTAPGAGGTPTANFTSSVSGLVATFTDTSTDSGGTISAHAWTFGDGGTSTSTSPSHTYAAAGTYSVSETVTDGVSGKTSTKTASVTVTSSGGGGSCGGTILCSGVPVTGLHATKGHYSSAYTMVVPAGQTSVTFQITGSTGDADLYVKIGSAPTTASYSCRPYLTGDNETCTFNSPTAGTYYVKVRAYATYSGVTLTGTITP